MVFVTRHDMFACASNQTVYSSAYSGKQSGKQMHARFDLSKAGSVLSALGASKGGKARAEKLTPEQRNEIATKAANTRWSKAKKEEE